MVGAARNLTVHQAAMSVDEATAGEADSRADDTPVTLQVSASPMDARHVREILPHQLRQFGHQVQEILLVLDQNRWATVSESVWAEGSAAIQETVAGLADSFPYLKVVEVDTSPGTVSQVVKEFFGGRALPSNDWRGGAIYPYLFGIWVPTHRHVLHFDSDMLFGGGSQTWVAEALSLLREKQDVLVCSPLPGPPRPDGVLTTQTLAKEPHDSLAFRTQAMSWRVFMLDRDRFRDHVGALQLLRSRGKNLVLARIDGYPPYETAETMLSVGIASNGLARVDFLGSGGGMWSLHPPYRSALFYNRLSWLIDAVEKGEVADAQRGDYDVNDSMIDWSDVRPTKQRRFLWHLKKLRQRIGR